MTLLDFNQQFADEQACQVYLEQIRWADGRYCPHCGSYETYKFKDGKLFKCADCKKQFTVKVGTIFSDSHVPLKKWFYAVYLNTSLKKGISSIQLAKYLGITQKSAWFMLQRIRYSVAHGTFDKPFDGTVEIDETYIGGKRRAYKGHAFSNKTSVIGIVEKKANGQIRTKVSKTSNASVALPFIRSNVKKTASIQTDESPIYYRVKAEYGHEFVTHKKEEYARGNVSTNKVEGAWKHLKAGLDAIYVGVSSKHLPLYCNEFDYRYNTRELTDGQRFEEWFKFVNGKSLTYKKLVG